MFDGILGMFSQDIAIDLGTANTLVHMRGRGIVLDEPSVVAITQLPNRKVVAVGHEAKEMLGKTPGSISAIRPMREGVIADFAVTQAMLRYFIRKAHGRNHFIRSRVVISIPAGITDVETKAVREAAFSANAREVLLIEQPMAAAVGAGLPVLDARGSMVIDIGGGTSDVAVISLGGLVTYKTLKVAGDRLDDAIIQYVRRRHNILVGERTAEQVKMKIGVAKGKKTVDKRQTEAKRDWGRDVDPDRELTVTVGATEGMYAAIQALIDPGDEVILIEPV